MVFLDAAAFLAIAAGAVLGARRGLWKFLAAGIAVSLGAASGLSVSGVLAAALRDLGVGPPGDAILGFFIPFALVSVYARFLAGLWLSRRLERTPERNRLLGALAGAVWMAFVAGLVARTCVTRNGREGDPSPTAVGSGSGVASPTEDRAGTERAVSSGSWAGPFVTWLARYPGRLGAFVVGQAFGRGTTDGGRRLAAALMRTLDGSRAQARAARGDAEARSSLGSEINERDGRDRIKRGVVPLRVEAAPRTGKGSRSQGR